MDQVFFRQQLFDRHIHEFRVADILFPVGKGQVQRLAHGMDVLWRVMAHRRQVETLQNLEGLREGRPLAPRPGAVDVIAAVVNRYRSANAYVITS